MPNNYYETVGSGNKSGDTITRVYISTKAAAPGLFAEYEHNEKYSDGYFNKLSSGIDYQETHAIVTLVFQREPGEDEYTDGQIVYNMTASAIEKPLEKHPNYRTIWNHDLWQANVSLINTFDHTAATNTLIPSAFQQYIKWSDSDAPPEGWHIAQVRTKPGVEAYLYPSPVVNATQYFDKRADASKLVRKIGSLMAPGYCFGYSKDYTKWIVNSSGMAKQGKFWTVTTEHMFASEGWDTDLYD
jgi:hypothetical protein